MRPVLTQQQYLRKAFINSFTYSSITFPQLKNQAFRQLLRPLTLHYITLHYLHEPSLFPLEVYLAHCTCPRVIVKIAYFSVYKETYCSLLVELHGIEAYQTLHRCPRALLLKRETRGQLSLQKLH